MKTAQMYYNGKKKVFEETFRSPFGKNTEEEALKVLENIRSSHRSSDGWLEIEGRVEQRYDKWYAVRHHAQYK